MDDDKVYKPQEIEDTPFPGQTGDAEFASSSGSSRSETFTSEKIHDNPFPEKRFAQELIGSALNTKSRKILGEFQFTETGALQIGKYQNGVSGDIRISPNGIVARDSAGNTTFALDGDTGDATFKGTVQTGTLITGSIITGQVDVGIGSSGSYVRLDGANNRIIIHDGTNPRIVIGNV